MDGLFDLHLKVEDEQGIDIEQMRVAERKFLKKKLHIEFFNFVRQNHLRVTPFEPTPSSTKCLTVAVMPKPITPPELSLGQELVQDMKWLGAQPDQNYRAQPVDILSIAVCCCWSVCGNYVMMVAGYSI